MAYWLWRNISMEPASGEITRLLVELRQGRPGAEAELLPLVYEHLHRLAAHYMRRERPDHTLQTTALLNEAYLRLVSQEKTDWQDRAHFFRIAARLMREILVDHARGRQAGKRGGLVEKLPLDEARDFSPAKAREVVELDEALRSLEQLDPQQGRIVELRFFGGLTVEETAEVLGISPRTVKRDWNVARAWLHGELTGKKRQNGLGSTEII
jgi:RNA polymerase sigma factor (TIGR02999 family)